jgi:hypothetical protein
VFAVSAVALGSSVIGFGVALDSQGVPPPSGSSLARLLMTAAFVAKTSLIQGFHTDATIEFGSGLEIFLTRVRFPLRRTYPARVLEPPLELPAVDRSAAPAPISEPVFLSSLTLSLSTLGVLLVLVFLVWILTRRMPLERRAKNNGWTLYAVTTSMTFLFGGACSIRCDTCDPVWHSRLVPGIPSVEGERFPEGGSYVVYQNITIGRSTPQDATKNSLVLRLSY